MRLWGGGGGVVLGSGEGWVVFGDEGRMGKKEVFSPRGKRASYTVWK